MKKLILAVLVLAGFAFWLGRVQAQTAALAPFSFSVQSPHTSCPAAVTGVSQYCFASDGIWQSLNGAAWSQVGTQANGVSSITVNSGQKQIGDVVLSIPTKATSTTQTVIQ